MRRLSAALLVLAVAAPAWASEVSLAPSEALRCMTPLGDARGAIKYPEVALERKEGGLVHTEMTFEDAVSPPSIKIVNQPFQALALSVIEHLQSFRVPCLQLGQRVVIRQDFRFDPTDGRHVLWTNARDAADSTRRQQVGCVKWPGKAPAYPAAALRRNEQGVVVMRLKFVDPDKPPEVTVLDNAPGSALIRAATDFASNARVPCLAGEPVEMQIEYRFRIADSDRIVLRDMPLRTLLGALKGIHSAQVFFDFNEMKCPFDVRLRMRQPVGDNRIGEVGESVPERAFFLDWLSRQRLDLKPEVANRLIGDQTTISVPCGTLNLGAKQGGGASQ
jgi:Gram-negative bacterial TonB protein C-terminal